RSTPCTRPGTPCSRCTSMYRSASRPARRPRAGPAAAASWSRSVGRCLATRVPWRLLGLFHADEERLELGRLHVRVADERGQRIREEARFRDPGEAPVERNADRVHGAAVDVERFDALRDDGDRGDAAAIRLDMHAIPGHDAELLREPLADLDELLGLDHRVEPHVLRPVVEVLREPVRRADVRETLGIAERLPVSVEYARRRIT